MIALVSALVAIGCALGSARRVWFAVHATAFDPEEVTRLLARAPGGKGIQAFRKASAEKPGAEWERELLAALATKDPETRAALVNEQMTELGHRLARWSAVPRVCARVTTSSAFLLATLVLREGLRDEGTLASDLSSLLWNGLIGQAFTVAAIGLIGTAWCVAAATHARRIARAKAAAADRMVERLEALAAEEHDVAGSA